jgi:antitoxin VapB
MPLIFDNPVLENCVRKLAKEQGETLTQAVLTAVQERQARLRKPKYTPEERLAIVRKLTAGGRLEPILDDRTPDEIIGYNEYGVPE